MNTARRLVATTSLFAAGALVGPALQGVVSLLEVGRGSPSSATAGTLAGVVLMLWPAQPIAVIEASVGTCPALAVAVGVNVSLFALMGFLAGVAARRRAWMVTLFALGLVGIASLALWNAGYDWRYIAVLGVGAAVALQAALFICAARLAA